MEPKKGKRLCMGVQVRSFFKYSKLYILDCLNECFLYTHILHTYTLAHAQTQRDREREEENGVNFYYLYTCVQCTVHTHTPHIFKENSHGTTPIR